MYGKRVKHSRTFSFSVRHYNIMFTICSWYTTTIKKCYDDDDADDDSSKYLKIDVYWSLLKVL
jgi:hypothetical protein